MVYFFHHYELPAILQQARIQEILQNPQNQDTQNNNPQQNADGQNAGQQHDANTPADNAAAATTAAATTAADQAQAAVGDAVPNGNPPAANPNPNPDTAAMGGVQGLLTGQNIEGNVNDLLSALNTNMPPFARNAGNARNNNFRVQQVQVYTPSNFIRMFLRFRRPTAEAAPAQSNIQQNQTAQEQNGQSGSAQEQTSQSETSSGIEGSQSEASNAERSQSATADTDSSQSEVSNAERSQSATADTESSQSEASNAERSQSAMADTEGSQSEAASSIECSQSTTASAGSGKLEATSVNVNSQLESTTIRESSQLEISSNNENSQLQTIKNNERAKLDDNDDQSASSDASSQLSSGMIQLSASDDVNDKSVTHKLLDHISGDDINPSLSSNCDPSVTVNALYQLAGDKTENSENNPMQNNTADDLLDHSYCQSVHTQDGQFYSTLTEQSVIQQVVSGGENQRVITMNSDDVTERSRRSVTVGSGVSATGSGDADTVDRTNAVDSKDVDSVVSSVAVTSAAVTSSSVSRGSQLDNASAGSNAVSKVDCDDTEQTGKTSASCDLQVHLPVDR